MYLFMFSPAYHQGSTGGERSSGPIRCQRCREVCKGEVVRVQDTHFHVKCFTCTGKKCKTNPQQNKTACVRADKQLALSYTDPEHGKSEKSLKLHKMGIPAVSQKQDVYLDPIRYPPRTQSTHTHPHTHFNRYTVCTPSSLSC